MVQQEDIILVNIYALNIGEPKHIRKTFEDFKMEINSNTVIIQNFNTHCQQWIDLPNKESTRILCH